jgi:hypothetical protein
VTQQERFEPMPRTALVIDGIGASATQVADGLVCSLWDINGGELSRAQQSGYGPGVALIGFKGRAGLFRNKGRGSNQAGHIELFEATGDHKPARAGFVSDLEVGPGVSFADSAEGFLEAVDIIGDGAEGANLALGAGFSDGNRDGVFVDIEA